MTATWSDSDESSSEEDDEIEEISNLYLMPRKETRRVMKMKRYMISTLLMNYKIHLMI